MAFKPVYTTTATVIGGRQGHGKTGDGRLEVDLSRPAELGGDAGAGTNPEQLFAVGWAACFEGALQGVAKESGADVSDASIDIEVSLGKTATGLGIGAAFDVTLPSVEDASAAAGLVTAAHGVCPYSNATRGNVPVTFKVNGAVLEA
jgi:osmotically inducible protein OsmC